MEVKSEINTMLSKVIPALAAYYEMYRAVAKARGLLLIDHYPSWLALREKDMAAFQRFVPDSIHPTSQGCAEIVTPAILAALVIVER